MCTRIDGALGQSDHPHLINHLTGEEEGGGWYWYLGRCISMIESQADVSHWNNYFLGGTSCTSIGLGRAWLLEVQM